MDALVTVETDLFDHRNVKPHFINPFCFGEDFASWLKNAVSSLEGSSFKFSDPIQEDYGWGFWARHGKDSFWVAISYVGDGPQETPAQWVISVNADSGLNIVKRLFHKPDRPALQELRGCVREAITSNPGIKVVGTPKYGQRKRVFARSFCFSDGRAGTGVLARPFAFNALRHMS